MSSMGRNNPLDITISDVQFIKDMYQIFLLRVPDDQGLASHVDALRNGATPQQIVASFLDSSEYRSIVGRPYEAFTGALIGAFDGAAPMPVELALTQQQEDALWAHVARTWTNLGATEPYWSVLTDPQWKSSEVKSADSLKPFYESGRFDVDRMEKWFTRAEITVPQSAICAEFGCGVGRCTTWLAQRFAKVIAFDISEPHIRLAKARAEREKINNIEFVLVRDKADLSKLSGIDFFYSVIVLQHNPPPVIVSILRKAFAGLSTNGTAFFQVPTFAYDYSFRLNEYLRRLTDRGLEMHFVPQRAILDLASDHGLRPLQVSPDSMTGNFDRWVSTSFLFRKAPPIHGSLK